MDPEFVPTQRQPQLVAPKSVQQYLRVGHTRPHDDVDVCHACGEIDAHTLPLLTGVLHSIASRANPWVLVDLSQVSFLGVDGARELSLAGSQARARDQEMGLIVATRAVRRALDVTGLDLGLPRYPHLSDALAQLAETAQHSPAQHQRGD